MPQELKLGTNSKGRSVGGGSGSEDIEALGTMGGTSELLVASN